MPWALQRKCSMGAVRRRTEPSPGHREAKAARLAAIHRGLTQPFAHETLMPHSYRIYQVDAFTRTRFSGNPAGVVPDAAGLDETQMQAIARELNNSETAFILPPRGRDHDVHVRFFTPTTEVPVCGHATIAAHYVRAIEGAAVEGTLHQLTGAGVLAVDVEPVASGDFRIWMHQREPAFGAVLDDGQRRALLAALHLAEDELGQGPIQIVSTGHSKV